MQVYYGAPNGLLGKPSRELAGFAKTEMLAPGESQELGISFPVSALLPPREAEPEDTADMLPDGLSFRINDAPHTYRLMIASAMAALAVILIVWQLNSQRRRWLERREKRRQRREIQRRQTRKNGEKTA